MRIAAEPLVQVEEFVEQLHELLRASSTERRLVRTLLHQAEALRSDIERENCQQPHLLIQHGREELRAGVR